MFKMKFDVKNSAFEDGNRVAETARILREIAEKLEASPYLGGGPVRDINGNTVGHWELTPTR